MIAILKRYSLALIFLFFVFALMLASTMGVMKFGDKMVQEIGTEMKPRGIHINKMDEVNR